MSILIVGQGLAGSSIALELIERGLDVTVAEPNQVNTSTSVAAGLVNPMVLKRMKKVWRADEFISYARTFYSSWEHKLAAIWQRDVPVYRRFHDVAEQNRWMELSTDSGLQAYIEPEIEQVPSSLSGLYGMAKVNRAGWFDTQVFMNSVRAYLQEEQKLEVEYVLDQEVNRSSGIEWRGQRYDALIWANGTEAARVSGFPEDVIRPSKGELLRLKLHEVWPTKAIIKAGVFILPIGRKELRVGATYDHYDLSPGISEKGQDFLEQQVADLLRVPYEIVGREWGIRPTTKDRRPLLGRHRDNENEYFFTGLGSRGVLMAPLLAKELADFILLDQGLRPDVDIARYY